MGWNDHIILGSFYEYEEVCPYCKEKFILREEPQVPGFRFPEDLICPYCEKVIRTSLEYEYYARKRK